MARFFSKGEKQADSVQEDVVIAQQEAEGVIDEAHDDLHREMKPRQLSAFFFSPWFFFSSQHSSWLLIFRSLGSR